MPLKEHQIQLYVDDDIISPPPRVAQPCLLHSPCDSHRDGEIYPCEGHGPAEDVAAAPGLS